MIIDRSHQNWVARTAAVAIGCGIFYLIYFMLRDVDESHAGTAPGVG